MCEMWNVKCAMWNLTTDVQFLSEHCVQKQKRQERHRFHIFAEERAQVVFQIEQARACHTRTGQIMMKFVQDAFETLVGPG